MSSLGPLVAADKTFNHQITDTFATVAQTDRSWTEKVWAMAARTARCNWCSVWANTPTAG